MAKIIFPNCSYLLVFGLPESMRSQIEAFLRGYQLRIVYEGDFAEFVAVLESLVYCPGVLVFFDLLPMELREKLTEYLMGRPELSFVILGSEFNHTTGIDPRFQGIEKPIQELHTDEKALVQLRAKVEEFLWSLLPSRFFELAEFCSQTVAGTLLNGLTKLSKVSPQVSGFDSALFYTISGGDWIGQCRLLFRSSDLLSNWPNLDKERLSNNLKEFANQFMGLVHFNLNKLGIFTKIGLPNSFELKNAPLVYSPVYLPSAHLSDDSGSLQVSLGYMNQVSRASFQLGSLEFATPSDDIEFL